MHRSRAKLAWRFVFGPWGYLHTRPESEPAGCADALPCEATPIFHCLVDRQELLLKSRMGAPIHWQNVQMYFHGAWINILAMMILDGPTVRAHGVFFGYGPFAWANVLCTAAMGLVMAALLKFLDNMARVYAAAVSMMVALVASWPLFGIPISPQVCAQPAHWGEGASSFTCARVARLILV